MQCKKKIGVKKLFYLKFYNKMLVVYILLNKKNGKNSWFNRNS